MINSMNNTLRKAYGKMAEIKDSQVEAIESIKIVFNNLEYIGVPNSVLNQIQFDITFLEDILLRVPSLVIVESIRDYDKAQAFLHYIDSIQPSLDEFKRTLDSISNVIESAINILNKDIKDIRRECVMLLLQADIRL